MGEKVAITCRNKECRYHVELSYGVGRLGFFELRKLEKQIINGDENVNPEIRELLLKGEHLIVGATYHCPKCKEWRNPQTPYIWQALQVSPNGTVRGYALTYLDDEPKCNICGSRMIRISNPLSGNNTCPKCGQHNMKARISAIFD